VTDAGTPDLVRAPSSAPRAGAPKRLLPVLHSDIADIDTWRSRTIATNDACLSCKYAFYCGGGCAAEALDQKGEFYTNHCNGFQQKFRTAAAEAFGDLARGERRGAPMASGCGV
jgi:sulfatase maturation enzyme AslB (radical SAM superfamily)